MCGMTYPQKSLKDLLFLVTLLSGGLLFGGEPKILWEMTAEKLPVLQLSHGAEVLAGNVLRGRLLRSMLRC